MAPRYVSYHMEDVQDFVIKNGIGIRINGRETCQVIRQQKGKWNEIGPVYPLPVSPDLLIWTRSGIPASVLAVALRVYELDHPETQLRAIITGKSSKRAAQANNKLKKPMPRVAVPIESEGILQSELEIASS